MIEITLDDGNQFFLVPTKVTGVEQILGSKFCYIHLDGGHKIAVVGEGSKISQDIEQALYKLRKQ